VVVDGPVGREEVLAQELGCVRVHHQVQEDGGESDEDAGVLFSDRQSFTFVQYKVRYRQKYRRTSGESRSVARDDPPRTASTGDDDDDVAAGTPTTHCPMLTAFPPF
jgi:hypothetical protein